MSITIRIIGLDKFTDKLKRFSPRLKSELCKAISQSAYLIERETKPITPVDTGCLRGSIRTNITGLRAIIAPTVDYAVFVHEGTRRWPLHMPPKSPGTVRQFLRIGAEKSIPRIRKYFEDAVRITIERA